MIVNPHLFNYRLIIGSLVIAIVGLSTFGYMKYHFLKIEKCFIEHENKLIENELSVMISSYELIENKNNDIYFQLEKANAKIIKILDTVSILKSNGALVSSYKIELKKLQVKNKLLSGFLETLTAENNALKQYFNSTLVDKGRMQVGLVGVNKLKYSSVVGARVKLNLINFVVEGIKDKTTLKLLKTKYASRINQIHVKFTIENTSAEYQSGEDLYLQILGPRNNIVADKGQAQCGKMSLIYTEKLTFNNSKGDLKANLFVKINPSETLVSGTYFVSVYYKGLRLGGTTIDFK